MWLSRYEGEILLEIKNTRIESFLKSFAFSFLLCLYPSFFAFVHIRALLRNFALFDLLWLIHNVIMALLFLIRIRPAVVSMNIIHWAVALMTSFSGFFLLKESASSNQILLHTTDVLILFAFCLQIAAALILGRSFGFLPALRRVKTQYLYQIVRHPMYLSSIIVKLAYVLRNPSIYNVLLLVVIAFLYDKRAKYEEDILLHDSSYVDYLQKVRYRFIPGIY